MLIFAIMAIVLIVIVITLVSRRRKEAPAEPQAGWTPTDELVKDPATGVEMRIWLDRTGQRQQLPNEPT
jgi:hypothetical protein